MKHLLLLVAFVIGLASIPTAAFAKDKKDYDDWHKMQKQLRNEVEALQKRWDLYGDRVKLAGDRRLWQQMQDIRVDIDRISGDVDSGNFDVRDIRNRMQRSDTDLLRVQAQLDYKSKRGGGFYRPN